MADPSEALAQHRLVEADTLEAVSAWAVGARDQMGDCHTALENVAGGPIARIPNWVRGIRTLFQYGLEREADAVARPMVEAAIILMWVGKSEERAHGWCHHCAQKVLRWTQGIRDQGANVSVEQLRFAEQYAAQFPPNNVAIGSLEDIAKSVKQSDHRGFAKSLYFYSYGRLCTSAHADHLSSLQAFYGLRPGRISAYSDAMVALCAIVECAPPLLKLPTPQHLIARVHKTLIAGKDL